MYTSKSGVKTLRNVPPVIPGDYDYLDIVPKAYGTQTSGSGDYYVPSAFPFTLANNSDALLLVDLKYLFVCYDGTASSFTTPDVMSPFNYVRGSSPVYTDTATPQFAMQYMALFFWTG